MARDEMEKEPKSLIGRQRPSPNSRQHKSMPGRIINRGLARNEDLLPMPKGNIA
jgi:hypothetical protein